VEIPREGQKSRLIGINKKTRYNVYKYIILIVVISGMTFSYGSIPSNIFVHNRSYLKKDEDSNRVLVIYVYADTHSFSKSNLEYFVRVGVHKSSNVDYYIILQQINQTYVNETNLPELPRYAHYIRHENKCFDLGTIGWFLSNENINQNNYKYFIFLNSSVRGPYLVSYYEYNQWYDVFTKLINNYTKLVGPTISCQGAPHVQSYFWVTDKEGLSLLLKNGDIFTCHQTQVDAIYGGEIPASKVMFDAGFGIDSLMKKYKGYDFRINRNLDCERMENPTSDKKVDGISLDPFEVVFIKLKFSTNDYQHVQSRISAYDKWIQ
jgi:hypothetical protein